MQMMKLNYTFFHCFTKYDSDGQFEADIVVLNSVCLQAVLHGQFLVKFLNLSNTFWMQMKSVPVNSQ